MNLTSIANYYQLVVQCVLIFLLLIAISVAAKYWIRRLINLPVEGFVGLNILYLMAIICFFTLIFTITNLFISKELTNRIDSNIFFVIIVSASLYGLQRIKWVNRLFDLPRPLSFDRKILVSDGKRFLDICHSDIAYIKESRGYRFLGSIERKEYYLGYTLDQVEKTLEQSAFRVNKNLIVHRNICKGFKEIQSGQFELKLSIPYKERIVVNKELTTKFRLWFYRQDASYD